MGGVLETYEKLIGQMLKQLPTPSPQTAGGNEHPASAITPAAGTASDAEAGAGGDVKTALTYILKNVRELRRHHYHEQDKILRGLQSLKHIQVERHRLPLREKEKETKNIFAWI